MNGDGYRNTWDRVENTRIMLIEISLSLPGGFFFIVMIPLNLIHFNHLSMGTSFFLIKDFDRIFLIREIRFHDDFLLVNNFFGNSNTFLELRYMKYIVDESELRGKLQSVSHWSICFNDLIRSDVTRS